MELLIVLTALCLLAQLALCYGSDRQYRLRSRDEEAASLGVASDARDGHTPRQPSITPAQ
jgi:hypothetical protein